MKRVRSSGLFRFKVDAVRRPFVILPGFGRLVRGLFGLLFAGVGLVFAWFMLGSLRSSEVSTDWPAEACTVTGTSISPDLDHAAGYVGELRYSHPAVEGVRAGTNRLARDSFTGIQEILERYPIGSVVEGRRNPADGTVTVRLREEQSSSLGILLVLAFPLIFVGIGARDLVGAIRGSPESDARIGEPSDRRGWLTGFLFGAVFLGVGMVATVFVLIVPVLEVSKARTWQQTPCVIEQSRVTASRGSKGGMSYQAEVLFRYEFGGAILRSDRTMFASGGVSGQQRSHDYVKRMVPGYRTVCFVDPGNPRNAVLDREDSGVLGPALIILVFPVAGAWMMVFGWKGRPVRQPIWRPLRR